MIAAVGLSNLQFVDMNAPRNLFIIGFAFFMGLSVPFFVQSSPFTFANPAAAPPQRVALPDGGPVSADPAAIQLLGLEADATVAEAKQVFPNVYVAEDLKNIPFPR